MITQDYLRSILNYNPETGEFTWIEKRNGVLRDRVIAGAVTRYGYRNIKIDDRAYREHRLAFLYMTGSIPKYVDHINNDRSDNRWENLREATKNQNGYNRLVNNSSETGVKGVTKFMGTGKYRARITVNGKQVHLGLWDDLEEAEMVVQLAREKYHGEFANHG